MASCDCPNFLSFGGVSAIRLQIKWGLLTFDYSIPPRSWYGTRPSDGKTA